jgi:hypothetical protein
MPGFGSNISADQAGKSLLINGKSKSGLLATSILRGKCGNPAGNEFGVDERRYWGGLQRPVHPQHFKRNRATKSSL